MTPLRSCRTDEMKDGIYTMAIAKQARRPDKIPMDPATTTLQDRKVSKLAQTSQRCEKHWHSYSLPNIDIGRNIDIGSIDSIVAAFNFSEAFR